MHIGIDPGKSGSICFLEDDDFEIIPTPVIKIGHKKNYDIPQMRSIVERMLVESANLCIIEKAQAMPGQGVTSMFQIGQGYGIWLGLLVAHGIPYIEIHPRSWTRKMFYGQAGEGKDRNYMCARQLFPAWNPKHKYEREYADSLLLADYGRRFC